MAYVDGYVLPVTDVAAYRKLARASGKIWLEHGALSYMECAADDVTMGKSTSFPRAVKLKEGETVIFAWVVYKSKASRNAINKKVMNDPRMQKMMNSVLGVVDGKRLIFGGFKPIVSFLESDANFRRFRRWHGWLGAAVPCSAAV